MLKKEGDGVRRTEGRALETLKKHQEQIRRYEDFAAELGQDPADVAAGLAAAPAGSHRADRGPAHPGAARRRHPRTGLTLDAGALKRLDEIFPGHRTAPEDYAW